MPIDQPIAQVTDAFVDSAITMSRRVLNNQRLLDLLLKADESPSDVNPFNHWSKLQLLVSRGRTPRNIDWVFHAMSLESKTSFWCLMLGPHQSV